MMMTMMTPLSSESLLEGFELVPDTPASARGGLGVGICMEDFDAPPSSLQQTYCKQLTETEYVEQSTSETEKALQELVGFLSQDKSLFRRLMQKRKLEELEQAGMMSFLKAKLLAKLHGDRYRSGLVTDSECDTRIKEVTDGIMKTYNYAQESKGEKYNTRQAAKQRAREQCNRENTPLKTMGKVKTCKSKNTLTKDIKAASAIPTPPPPPPGPPPLLTPAKPPRTTGRSAHTQPVLKDSTNMATTPDLGRRPLRKSVERADSVKSLHQELVSSNPLKRLRMTKKPRSPGGTPVRNSKRLRTSLESLRFDTPAGLNTPSSEPLTSMFMRIMEQKFKNVRSPSPATPGRLNLTASPQAGFTP